MFTFMTYRITNKYRASFYYFKICWLWDHQCPNADQNVVYRSL